MSPAEFDKCQSGGGKVRTIAIKGGRYAHVCISKDGKTHLGEIKSKKEASK